MCKYITSPTGENRYITSPTGENRYITSPTGENRYITSPTGENRYITSPTRENRYITSPTRENRYITSPTGENRYITSPTGENRYITSPTGENRAMIDKPLIELIEYIQSLCVVRRILTTKQDQLLKFFTLKEDIHFGVYSLIWSKNKHTVSRCSIIYRSVYGFLSKSLHSLIALIPTVIFIIQIPITNTMYIFFYKHSYVKDPGTASHPEKKSTQSRSEEEDPGAASHPRRKRTQKHPDTIGTRDLPCPPSKAEMGRHQCKSTYNNMKNKTSPESSPPPTPRPEQCNVDKAEEKDLKNNLMKMIEEALEGKMKNAIKEIKEKTNKKLEEMNKEIEGKNKKIEDMNKEIEDKN
ncbi:hypothetical protein STEG23_031154 [Scotinomys teguina]